ncbi:hypothetical protein ARALYDRAFT_916206 [Arabidopsis lyrata subsp. lyrata]|uniref:RING-type domain-containing protein n=1 Tax=Arabidopsis lyrata subsp. lyrata TaxID=81972 RepID=D7MJ87_ARALL|nr:hypothetical protein ARALYDRAFT_916206 [Arabidopsis lyrata subsp. lyrata]
MKRSSEDGNTQSPKRQRTRSETGTLLDLDVLDCPICYEPLTIPLFQCDNGHVACRFCWPKLGKKCPACVLPIGNKRCIAMESVLKSSAGVWGV